MAKGIRLTVDVAVAGERLDVFLAIRGAVPSAAAARRAIAAGTVRVDGRREKKGARVRAGQVVELLESESGEAVPTLALEVLYEDADIVAVAKPGGVASHPLRPGETGTVADALVARFPECAEASPDRREGGLGHRLDHGTSGVLIAARHPEAWRLLRAALGAPDCQKIYLAEVIGRLAPTPVDSTYISRPSADTWLVDAPIGRTGRRGGRVRLGGGRQPLPARTEVRVVEERESTTLVEACLSKGRAHQVRAHLAHLGNPVVGDDVYGAETNSPLHLHALTVKFTHPTTNQPLRIQAPPPSWAAHRVVK